MFFIVTFIISLVAIIILHYGIRKEKSEKLLHDFKKLCSIDSVAFESNLKNILQKIKLKTKRYLSYIKTFIHHIAAYFSRILTITKRSVRKRLFQNGSENQPSKHIKELKK